MPSWNDILKKATALWRAIGLNQKITIGAMVVSLLVAVFFFGDFAKKPEFSLLYSRLNSDDAGKIVETLQEATIPYQIKANGSAIYVPSKQVYEMRLKMAKKGIPKGGGVGFEIFDKTNIGVTDFVQKLNYNRALEGELTRTIMEMDGVVGARVHLVVPEQKLFSESQEKPTASVVLSLSSPSSMDFGQIAGIKNLIAGAVEGLRPNSISIIDTQGNILSKALASDDNVSDLSSVQLGQKKSVEKYLAEKAQSLLEAVLGKNNAMVRVDALLDFDREERTEEIYDPEKAVVRTETITSEKSKGFAGPPKGVPGVASNVGEPEGQVSNNNSKESNKSKETIKNTYEIDKVIKHIIPTVGSVKKMSVAVFIKKKVEIGADGTKTTVSRSPEELLVYEDIVKNALGFDKKRGDDVAVKEMDFDTSLMSDMAESMKSAAQKRMVESITKNVITAIIILCFPVLFLVMLNMLKKPKKVQAVLSPEQQIGSIELKRKEDELKLKAKLELEANVMKIADENPEELAQLIAGWVDSDDQADQK